MYDVIIIGAGPGGIFSAYELMKQDENLKIAVFDAGHSLEQRHCPIDGEKVKSCIGCKTCAIMNGFGGAGAFSDGKYNITNDFGGTLYEYIGRQKALELMKYVDTINMSHGGEGTKMYSTAGTDLKKVCLQNKLKLLDASVRHLGTDVNYVVLKNLYDEMKEHMDFFFDTPVEKIQVKEDGYTVSAKDAEYACRKCIVSVGRSGSKWMETVCEDLEIPTKSNRVDIGVRVELPAVIFSHLTDELYESKIVYRTEKFEDNVRTFCMNPLRDDGDVAFDHCEPAFLLFRPPRSEHDDRYGVLVEPCGLERSLPRDGGRKPPDGARRGRERAPLADALRGLLESPHVVGGRSLQGVRCEGKRLCSLRRRCRHHPETLGSRTRSG